MFDSSHIKREAEYYVFDGEQILCKLCPNFCRLGDGGLGVCKGRKRYGDKLYSINYGKITALALDPIEKKPLFHYKPGSYILSVGSFGCNFSCGFCQNYEISQKERESQYVSPNELVKMAESIEDNIGIAFTYNEPSISFEYIKDVCNVKKNSNLDMVMITNGYICEEPLEEILPFIKAFNIDLKGFSNDFYTKSCGGNIEHVLRTIKKASKYSHVEITTLLIEGYNDKLEEIEEMCKWIADIGRDIPLHLTRYFPRYKFSENPTSKERLLEAQEIAKKYLNNVHLGNI